MSADVVTFPGITKLDLPPERLLTQALEAQPDSVVIVGYGKDGEFYFASSKADGAEVLWLLELAKKRLLEVGDAG